MGESGRPGSWAPSGAIRNFSRPDFPGWHGATTGCNIHTMTRLVAVVVLSFLALAASRPAIAEVTVIDERCSYVMGDNDTKNDARQMCFLDAKRRVLEKAGSFIQSRIVATDGRLTKDKITAYSAAILKVEVTGEKVMFNGQSMVMKLSVRARVDMDDVRKRLAAIAGDRSIQKKIEAQQSQISGLEAEVADLKAALNQAGPADARTLRKRRNVVVKQIDELESLHIAIVKKIRTAENRVVRFVELGMTPAEVKQVAGKPRSVGGCGEGRDWSYGRTWVLFESGVVSCVIKASSYRRCSNCGFYRTVFGGVIK